MPSGLQQKRSARTQTSDCICEHLPLYRGQVIEHLFISSENFGEGLKRALAYQRLISDAFHAKLVVEDDRCYLTNGEQPFAESLVNRHFTECAMSGVLRFFKFITEGRFEPIYIDFNFPKARQMKNISGFMNVR